MNYKVIAILLVLFLTISFSYSKEIKYKVSDIPKELLKGSKSVIRENNVVLTVSSESHAEMEFTFAITILKEEAFEHAIFFEYYDQFRKIDFYSGLIYNAEGEQIEKIKRENILDYAAMHGFSLYEDGRVKYIKPEVRQYPFTVEYKYKIIYSSLLHLPLLYLENDYYMSSEHTLFTLVDPNDNMRYYENNILENIRKENKNETHTAIWEFKNTKAVSPELFSRSKYEILPSVRIAPIKFKIQKYEGRMDQWKEFGFWINKLNKNRNELPKETISTLIELTDSVENKYEKIKIIYEFLQKKTRYVSIQIGIGGFQPIKASLTDKYSYGDCKALSFYMKSMLDVIGIESYYTLVMAGSDAIDMMQEFPSSQFNHAILCVPLEKDTIWLECTNQNVPFGYIGDFTDDRYVLLITDEGGVLKKTRAYSADENKKITTTHITLEETGDAKADISREYIGLKYDEIYPVLYSDQKDKKRRIEQRVEFPKFDLIDFSHKEVKDEIPIVYENINLVSPNYAGRIGDRFMVLGNPVNRVESIPRQRTQRKNSVYIRRSFIETDTIVFSYPPALEVEALPDPVSVSSRFGNFSYNMSEKDGKVVLVRKIEIKKGEHAPETFGEMIEFMEQIVAADKNKFILKKII